MKDHHDPTKKIADEVHVRRVWGGMAEEIKERTAKKIIEELDNNKAQKGEAYGKNEKIVETLSCWLTLVELEAVTPQAY